MRMNTMRFNVTLPKDIGTKLRATPNRSALIAQSLREKFDREEKARFDKLLGQAYADSAEEDREINKDFDSTTGDGIV